jgi:formate dehydrogenase alpha subunit
VAGLAAAFGSGAMTNSIEELADADTIFIIGSNTTAAHPLVATRIFRAKAKGAKVIVADPRRIQISLQADLYVSQKLGTDAALINGIMHVILKEGWHNQEFIDERCEGFDEFRETVEKYTPEKAEEITGIKADDIREIARMYATAEKGTIVYCMGITQHTCGVDNVKSLANLAMLCGHIGRESTGVNPLRGQNNVQGACDMGGLPNVYPGYQPVVSLDAKIKFQEAWGVENLSDKLGLTIPDMINGITDGTVHALYVMGENPVMSDPDAEHVIHALDKIDFLVVQDIFLNETAKLADVVLPGASYAEKDGTFSNSERRVQRVRKAVEPVGEAKADWEIIQEISNRFGFPMEYESPAAIMDEIAAVTPQYAGVSYDRLEGEGLCWPVPSADHPGTKFLHQGRFAKGMGTFHAIEHKDPDEVVDGEYPLWLTTGRAHVHYHTGTMTRNSPTLHRQMPEGYAEISPAEAESLGAKSGDEIRLTTRRGSIKAKAMITDRVNAGTVFLPFHFIESCANVLTNPAHDPIVKIPEYKVCAVKLEKVA